MILPLHFTNRNGVPVCSGPFRAPCITLCNEIIKDSNWREIQLNKYKMLVGVSYRVPDATEEVDQGMYKLLETANKDTALIMGDFSCHY